MTKLSKANDGQSPVAPEVPVMKIEDGTETLQVKPKAVTKAASKPQKVTEFNGMKIEDF